jgi:agmatinase
VKTAIFLVLCVVVSAIAFAAESHEKNIQPTIPMDIADPTIDMWKARREDLQQGREPGLINIQRAPGGYGYNGIPTFFRLPVALTPADLKAGDVDVAFIAAYVDMGLGQRGANRGPNALRHSPAEYVTWGAFSMPHMETMINPLQDIVAVDYGDAPNDPLSTERTMEPIRAVVREAIEVENSRGKHVIPFVIGGDHSISYPSIAAAADVYGKGNVGVVHFDAHYDGTMLLGHLASHGAWVKRLIDEGHVPGKNFIQVGLRGYYPDADTFQWMRDNEFRYHTMAEVDKRGWDAVTRDVLREANDGPENLYISFDIDVIDPAYMSGTGTPEPGGITNRQAFRLLRRLCAESNVIGIDILELAPERDPGYTTVHNTNRLVRECMVGIGLRKMGITDPDYMSPLTVDDGRK